MCIPYLRKIILPGTQNTVGIWEQINLLILYLVSLRLVTILKFIVAPTQISNVLFLLLFKVNWFYPLFIPEMSNSLCLTLLWLSAWICFGSCSHCSLASFLWSANFKHSSSFCGVVFIWTRLSVAENLVIFLIFSNIPLKNRTSSILECHLLSFSTWSAWLWVVPSGEVWVYLWMFQCRNIIFLTSRVFDVTKFTVLTPLSVLFWCKISFPVVGLQTFSFIKIS